MALAFISSGVAEVYFGLATIIGAYPVGLALSNTDLRQRIAEPLRQIGDSLVPVFFVVTGMQANLGAMFGGTHGPLASTLLFAVVLCTPVIVRCGALEGPVSLPAPVDPAPRAARDIFEPAPVAQGIEHRPPKPGA